MTTPDTFNPQLSTLFDQIVAHGEQQVLILTPNKRLSRYLVEQYNHYQGSLSVSAKRKNAWSTLNCHSFHGWIQQQWDRLNLLGEHPLSHRSALTPFQETSLWEKVIESHEKTPPLLAIQATAKLAQNAWRLMHEWHLDLNEYQDSDTQLFLAWCQSVQKKCDEKRLLSPVQQANAVIEATHDHQAITLKNVFLYGFDELSPQIQTLISAFAVHNITVESIEIPPQNSLACRYAFPDENHEIEAAALWAKDQLTKRQTTNDTTAKIAIVVPNLAQNKERIERIFNSVFHPQSIFPSVPQHAPGYNLSAATPLSHVPLIHVALNILGCHQQWIDIELISQLLRSPFVGVMGELDDRALIDLALRGHEFDISLKHVKAATGNGDTQARTCPDFYQRIGEFETIINKHATNTLYPSQWIPVFTSLLTAFGWPGNRPLDSIEYQQFQAWNETLNEFAGLDHLFEKITLSDANRALKRLVTQSSFKAQTKDSPIQILGVLEAAGLPFDSLWFMNLDDETWPPAPNPNPFIPITLQVQKQLPQSAANRELIYAKRLTERFIKSASEVVFSYAEQKEGQQLLPSPLIQFAPQEIFSLEKRSSYAEQLFQHRQTDYFWDQCGPHVKNVEAIRGGSQLLKDQAACPFRAFAKHRLHSEGIPSTTIGLDASERGNILHASLELIWKKIRTQEKLLSLEVDTLNEIILSAIDTAMLEIKSKRFVGERFLRIETQRLQQQIHHWLNIEKQRAPFTVVSNEGKRTVKLGALPIKIRYDRVDKLEDGSLFVLDYKSGKPSIYSWNSDRPDEPQVPLYCIANQDKVAGAAFGQINAEEIAIKGIAADGSIAPGLKPVEKITVIENTDNWDTAVKQWRTVLEKLTQEFLAGSAEVNPKKPAETCRFCELGALCRIKDQHLEGKVNSDE